jgi:hypothetical protein
MRALLQGGLLRSQTMQSSEPLQAALDAAVTALRATAADPEAGRVEPRDRGRLHAGEHRQT